MTIIGTVGRLGKGKTLGGVIEAYRDFCYGRTIFSNIWLGFPHLAIRHPYDFLDIVDGFLLADELWTLCDNRKSMSLLSDIVTILCIRSRKRRFHVYYTQQFLQIDIRIRFITDFWIRPSVFPIFEETGEKPQVLTQEIYDGEFKKLPQRDIQCEPYLELYDTEADPYTFSSMLSVENLKMALDHAIEKYPNLVQEAEELRDKAKAKLIEPPKDLKGGL